MLLIGRQVNWVWSNFGLAVGMWKNVYMKEWEQNVDRYEKKQWGVVSEFFVMDYQRLQIILYFLSFLSL